MSSILQINNVLKNENRVSLNDKKNVVKFMTNYANQKHFNFSYDVPFGEEIGYPYLFKWRKHEPENIPEARLYTLSRSPLENEKVIYSKKGLSIIER
jgi:hemerythrin